MEQWNLERAEDVLRIAADSTGTKFEELNSAQLLWVDRLGMYLHLQVRLFGTVPLLPWLAAV